MEGACIYINSYNNSCLLMYKEFIKNTIFFILYTNNSLFYQYTSSKYFTNIIPKNCIHILTKLPYYHYSFNKTISIWRDLALTSLNNHNKKNLYKNDFNIKFKIQ